jgi:hypothetical protein
VAFAAVNFDPATGFGFVGKGDVQTVFNLNNTRMQAVASSVTFTYENVTTYEADCVWTTGRSRHIEPVTTTIGVAGSIAADPRRTGQWTGWNLNGYVPGQISLIGTVPVNGAACVYTPGESESDQSVKNGVYENVVEGASTNKIYASIGGVSREIADLTTP